MCERKTEQKDTSPAMRDGGFDARSATRRYCKPSIQRKTIGTVVQSSSGPDAEIFGSLNQRVPG